MDLVREFFLWLWTLDAVRFISAHVAVNVVVALAAALYAGDFKPHKLAEFLYKKLLPFVCIYGIVKLIGMEAGLEPLAPAVFAIIEATLAADLVENLDKLGIPMPEPVARLVSK